MTRSGFTIVEIIITIAIMGILLTLAVVGVNTTQANARDTERKADVEAFAVHLESFYRSGTDGSTNFNRYPTTNAVTTVANLKSTFRDLDLKSVSAPGISDPLATILPATNNVQTTTGVLPQPTKDQYVYQPIMPTGALCTSGNTDCRKFNIYYRLEKDNLVYMITSKNQ
jgi:prepilin-type N-terminal cleavage/methylation domain-containing protein